MAEKVGRESPFKDVMEKLSSIKDMVEKVSGIKADIDIDTSDIDKANDELDKFNEKLAEAQKTLQRFKSTGQIRYFATQEKALAHLTKAWEEYKKASSEDDKKAAGRRLMIWAHAYQGAGYSTKDIDKGMLDAADRVYTSFKTTGKKGESNSMRMYSKEAFEEIFEAARTAGVDPSESDKFWEKRYYQEAKAIHRAAQESVEQVKSEPVELDVAELLKIDESGLDARVKKIMKSLRKIRDKLIDENNERTDKSLGKNQGPQFLTDYEEFLKYRENSGDKYRIRGIKKTRGIVLEEMGLKDTDEDLAPFKIQAKQNLKKALEKANRAARRAQQQSDTMSAEGPSAASTPQTQSSMTKAGEDARDAGQAAKDAAQSFEEAGDKAQKAGKKAAAAAEETREAAEETKKATKEASEAQDEASVGRGGNKPAEDAREAAAALNEERDAARGVREERERGAAGGSSDNTAERSQENVDALEKEKKAQQEVNEERSKGDKTSGQDEKPLSYLDAIILKLEEEKKKLKELQNESDKTRKMLDAASDVKELKKVREIIHGVVKNNQTGETKRNAFGFEGNPTALGSLVRQKISEGNMAKAAAYYGEYAQAGGTDKFSDITGKDITAELAERYKQAAEAIGKNPDELRKALNEVNKKILTQREVVNKIEKEVKAAQKEAAAQRKEQAQQEQETNTDWRAGLNEQEIEAVEAYIKKMKALKKEAYNESSALAQAMSLLEKIKKRDVSGLMDQFTRADSPSSAMLSKMTNMPVNNQKARNDALRSLNQEEYDRLASQQTEGITKGIGKAVEKAKSETQLKWEEFADAFLGTGVFADKTKGLDKHNVMKQFEKYGNTAKEALEEINKQWLSGTLDRSKFSGTSDKFVKEYIDALDAAKEKADAARSANVGDPDVNSIFSPGGTTALTKEQVDALHAEAAAYDDLIAKKKEYYGIKEDVPKKEIDIFKESFGGLFEGSDVDKSKSKYADLFTQVKNGSMSAKQAIDEVVQSEKNASEEAFDLSSNISKEFGITAPKAIREISFEIQKIIDDVKDGKKLDISGLISTMGDFYKPDKEDIDRAYGTQRQIRQMLRGRKLHMDSEFKQEMGDDAASVRGTIGIPSLTKGPGMDIIEFLKEINEAGIWKFDIDVPNADAWKQLYEVLKTPPSLDVFNIFKTKDANVVETVLDSLIKKLTELGIKIKETNREASGSDYMELNDEDLPDFMKDEKEDSKGKKEKHHQDSAFEALKKQQEKELDDLKSWGADRFKDEASVPEELRDLYGRTRDFMSQFTEGDEVYKAEDAINGINEKAKELGYTFDEVAGKWQKITSSGKESTQVVTEHAEALKRLEELQKFQSDVHEKENDILDSGHLTISFADKFKELVKEYHDFSDEEAGIKKIQDRLKEIYALRNDKNFESNYGEEVVTLMDFLKGAGASLDNKNMEKFFNNQSRFKSARFALHSYSELVGSAPFDLEELINAWEFGAYDHGVGDNDSFVKFIDKLVARQKELVDFTQVFPSKQELTDGLYAGFEEVGDTYDKVCQRIKDGSITAKQGIDMVNEALSKATPFTNGHRFSSSQQSSTSDPRAATFAADIESLEGYSSANEQFVNQLIIAVVNGQKEYDVAMNELKAHIAQRQEEIRAEAEAEAAAQAKRERNTHFGEDVKSLENYGYADKDFVQKLTVSVLEGTKEYDDAMDELKAHIEQKHAEMMAVAEKSERDNAEIARYDELAKPMLEQMGFTDSRPEGFYRFVEAIREEGIDAEEALKRFAETFGYVYDQVNERWARPASRKDTFLMSTIEGYEDYIDKIAGKPELNAVKIAWDKALEEKDFQGVLDIVQKINEAFRQGKLDAEGYVEGVGYLDGMDWAKYYARYLTKDDKHGHGARYLDEVPEGWKKIEGALTAPKGYEWYSNVKSRFSGEYQQALVKIKEAADDVTESERQMGQAGEEAARRASLAVEKKPMRETSNETPVSQGDTTSSGLDSSIGDTIQDNNNKAIASTEELISTVKELEEIYSKFQRPKYEKQESSYIDQLYDVEGIDLSGYNSVSISEDNIKQTRQKMMEIYSLYKKVTSAIKNNAGYYKGVQYTDADQENLIKDFKAYAQNYHELVTEYNDREGRISKDIGIDPEYLETLDVVVQKLTKDFRGYAQEVITDSQSVSDNNRLYEEEQVQLEQSNAALRERYNLLRNQVLDYAKSKGIDDNQLDTIREMIPFIRESGFQDWGDLFDWGDISSLEHPDTVVNVLQEILRILGIEIPEAAGKAKKAISEVGEGSTQPSEQEAPKTEPSNKKYRISPTSPKIKSKSEPETTPPPSKPDTTDESAAADEAAAAAAEKEAAAKEAARKAAEEKAAAEKKDTDATRENTNETKANADTENMDTSAEDLGEDISDVGGRAAEATGKLDSFTESAKNAAEAARKAAGIEGEAKIISKSGVNGTNASATYELARGMHYTENWSYRNGNEETGEEPGWAMTSARYVINYQALLNDTITTMKQLAKAEADLALAQEQGRGENVTSQIQKQIGLYRTRIDQNAKLAEQYERMGDLEDELVLRDGYTKRQYDEDLKAQKELIDAQGNTRKEKSVDDERKRQATKQDREVARAQKYATERLVALKKLESDFTTEGSSRYLSVEDDRTAITDLAGKLRTKLEDIIKQNRAMTIDEMDDIITQFGDIKVEGDTRYARSTAKKGDLSRQKVDSLKNVLSSDLDAFSQQAERSSGDISHITEEVNKLKEALKGNVSSEFITDSFQKLRELRAELKAINEEQRNATAKEKSRNKEVKDIESKFDNLEAAKSRVTDVETSMITNGRTPANVRAMAEAILELAQAEQEAEAAYVKMIQMWQKGELTLGQREALIEKYNSDEVKNGSIASREAKEEAQIQAKVKLITELQESYIKLAEAQEKAEHASTEAGRFLGQRQTDKIKGRQEELKKQVGQFVSPDVLDKIVKDAENQAAQLKTAFDDARNGGVSVKDLGFGADSDVEKTWNTLINKAQQYQKIVYKQDTGQALTINEVAFLQKLGPLYEQAAQHADEAKDKFEKLQAALSGAQDNIAQNIIGKYDESIGGLTDENKDMPVAYNQQVTELKANLEQLKNTEFGSPQWMETIKLLDQGLKNLNTDLSMQPVSENAVAQLDRQMASWQNVNSRAGEFLGQVQALRDALHNVRDQEGFNGIQSDFERVKAAAADAGKTGQSFGEGLIKRFKSLGQYLLSFASFYRIIGTIKQAVSIVTELNDALTEMRKVSSESLSTLEKFQFKTFDLADQVGTNAVAVQKSTAAWLRLGKDFNEAQQAAVDSTKLLNTTEIENIDDATSSLLSITQAYREITREDAIDKINNIGDHFSSSSADLAQGLKNVSAVLKTQGNDIDQALALLTAGKIRCQMVQKCA